MKFSTFVFSCLLTWVSFTSAYASQEPAVSDPKLGTFFKNRQFGAAVLSPNAKNLAVTTLGSNSRLYLAIIDLDTRKATPLASYSDADVCRMQWMSNDRLIFDLRDLDGKDNSAACGNGMFAVNRDGTDLVELVSTIRKQIDHIKMTARLGGGYIGVITTASMVGSYGDGSNDILVYERLWNEKNERSIYKINTLTGRKQEIYYNVSGIPFGFITDNQQRLRVVVSGTENMKSSMFWYRDDTDKPWRKLAEIDNYNPKFWVEGFGADNQTMYVTSRGDGDKWGLYKYDFEKNQVGEKIASDPNVDIGELIVDHGTQKLLGIRFESDPPRTDWIDPDFSKAQEEVDGVFPDRINVLSGDPKFRILVHSYSAKNPGEYYLYDPTKQKLEFMFKAMPWIKSENMSDQLVFDYTARDGLHIPSYLTIPKGKSMKSLPLIVYVHGGPYARDYWGFDPVVQFLANLGYAVLQPEYRGSMGFGTQHFIKGWKTWGLAMQDDITDGVQNLVKQGVVDPARVCIMGASYGGYAALMGLVKEPDLFRCGIDLLGVTDINLLFTMGRWSNDDAAIFGNRILIGDPDTMKAQFETTSPLKQADKIKAPVFMAYNGKDNRVPIEHGKKMKKAMEKSGKYFEWMEFPDEEHGFVKEEDRYKVYGAIEKFLKTYNPAD